MDLNFQFVEYKNPHVKEMKEDFLYHIGLGTATHDLVDMFGDVKVRLSFFQPRSKDNSLKCIISQFVCMGGTPHRMENFANFIMKEIGYKLPPGASLHDISRHSHRYAMYKVGPVLSISHGMGVPSLSILLHEVIKLLAHAGAEDPIFFRIGTCGGIGEEGGSVVVSEAAFDGMLRPVHETIVLGKLLNRPCVIDPDIVQELVALGDNMPFPVVSGKTICTHDFYEGQGRLDGAFCDYSEDDKMAYLNELSEAGVKNIEMEATAFAALTHHAGVKAAIVCVALLDRLKGDQVTTPKAVMEVWQNRPQRIVAEFIKRRLNVDGIAELRKQQHLEFKKRAMSTRYTSYEDQKRGSSARSSESQDNDSNVQ